MEFTTTELEARVLELQAQICRALSDPKRLRVLYFLDSGEHSVSEIAAELGISIPNTSQHLGILRSNGLVLIRREGTTVYYRLAYPEIIQACRSLKSVLVRQLREDGKLSGELERILQ